MEYSWDIKKIKESNIDEKTKNILLAEASKKVSKYDPFLYKQLTLKKFKKEYEKSMIGINNISKDLYKTLFIIKQYSKKYSLPYYISNPLEVPNETLINVTRNLLNYTEDKEFISIYDYILNNNLIQIFNRKDNIELSRTLNGRCIHAGDDAYLSIYKNDTIDDLKTFCHEIGHMISFYLFKNNRNFYFNNIYKEVESYFFEFILIDYLQLNEDLKKYSKYYEINRLLYILDNIDLLLIQNVISEICNRKIDTNLLNSTLGYKYQKKAYTEVMNMDTINLYDSSISYFIALELYNIYKNDIDKGLYTFKSLLSDKNNNLIGLLDKYDINFVNSPVEAYKLIDEIDVYNKQIKKRQR